MVQFVCMTRSDASEVMEVFIMSYQNYKEAMELAPKNSLTFLLTFIFSNQLNKLTAFSKSSINASTTSKSLSPNCSISLISIATYKHIKKLLFSYELKPEKQLLSNFLNLC